MTTLKCCNKSMDTLKIKTELMGMGCSRVNAVVLSLLMASTGFASDVVDDENSLANRLKEFNQPTQLASAKKVSLDKSLSNQSRKKRRSYRPACYRSSASVLRDRASQYQPFIRANSRRYSVDESLIISVITAESCFVPHARSPKGAQGLMQLIPATAKRFGVSDAYQPAQNIRGGTRYLKFLLKRFSGNMRYAVAAYNAGEGAVDRYGGIPPYRETKEYVRRVMAVYDRLNGGRGLSAPVRAETVRQAVIATKQSASKRGYFIKPDYQWKSKPGRKKLTNRRVSRTYNVTKRVSGGSGACRDISSHAMRRTTDLIKRTKLWSRYYTVKKPIALSRIARRTGVPVKVLLRLNRGISRLSVKPGRRVLVWQCSKR